MNQHRGHLFLHKIPSCINSSVNSFVQPCQLLTNLCPLVPRVTVQQPAAPTCPQRQTNPSSREYRSAFRSACLFSLTSTIDTLHPLHLDSEQSATLNRHTACSTGIGAWYPRLLPKNAPQPQPQPPTPYRLPNPELSIPAAPSSSSSAYRKQATE